MWQETCGARGSCWIYDKWPLGVRLMLWWMGTKLVGFVLLLIASFVYKPEVTQETQETEKSKNNIMERTAADNPVFSVLDEDNYNVRL